MLDAALERCVLSRTFASLPRLTTKSQPLSTTPSGLRGSNSSSYKEMRLCRRARIQTPKSIVIYKNRNPSRVAWSFFAFRASSASRRPTVSLVLSVGFVGTGASTSILAGCPMALLVHASSPALVCWWRCRWRCRSGGRLPFGYPRRLHS